MQNDPFLKDSLDRLHNSVDDIRKEVGEMREDIRHYKGFVSGVLFVGTVIWGGITFFWDKIGGRA